MSITSAVGPWRNPTPRKAHLNFRNNLFLLFKNDHRSGIRGRIFRRQILDGMAAVRFLLEGKWTFFKAVIQAHSDFRSHMGALRNKRAKELAECSVPRWAAVCIGGALQREHCRRLFHPEEKEMV